MEILNTTSPTRKEMYRAFLRRFNPAQTPDAAMSSELVEDALSTERIRNLMAAMLLRPGSQHLLVGGIGSGKSTELRLLTQAILHAKVGEFPLYLDVSQHADLNRSQPGAILLAIGRALRLSGDVALVSSDEAQESFSKIEALASGYWDWVPPNSYDDREPSEEEIMGFSHVHRKGLITPPVNPILASVESISVLLAKLIQMLSTQGKELVVVLDGMDRLLDPLAYWDFVDQDFAALRKLKISIVSAAPLSLLYSKGRIVLDHFDSFHHIPPIGLDKSGLELLKRLLTKREIGELVHPSLLDQICIGSGGVLRDLISIVQDAAQNAYIDSCDWIDQIHVERAVLQLGNAYKLGLSGQERVRLQHIHRGGAFSPASKQDLELLLHRRLLERGESYSIHPALLEALKVKK